jgi:hypothetical protein
MDMKIAAFAILGIVVTGWSAEVFADTPPSSCTGRNERAWTRGVSQGYNMASQAWNSVNDCDELEWFTDILVDNVEDYVLSSDASRYTACQYGGFVDGIYNKLDQVWNHCRAECQQEGVAWAEVSSAAYCKLSIALGGLALADQFIRGPVLTCGVAFQLGCDPAFLSFARAFVAAGSSCERYTREPYRDVFEQSRHNQCAYDPQPDEE